MPSQRFNTARAFTSSYENFDLDTMLGVRSPECKHSFITAGGEYPIMSNSQFAAFYEPIRPLLERSTFHIERAIEDDKANEMALWCSIEIHFKNKAVQPYRGHYVFLLEFSADEKTVTMVREVVDRVGAGEYMDKVKQARELTRGTGDEMASKTESSNL
ncbi:uncharacterized protein Z518_11313 [Rhinocladiella mackenziei CBS 650.93]|uniref:SnoaL-like domain-containing protein n=1 Tax=Rhinocladiella mackenziei CBS 650.93 TaxID=1442369 RepID=A0A0D2IS73_9EURO|nr:uncharacterized protein Z518_11313 [Rhinocladiella mackenziei CBS 650.93]KIW99574.1 hypothetical protein Z518_11313 [Rhinocladiella mackenziei CBS 650.93]